MGPRPRGRGISGNIASTTVTYALQWGRDRAVAELLRQRLAAPLPLGLQWGRDRAVAEFVSEQGEVRLDPIASMGPRPRGRGILGTILSPSRIIGCFNGAATARSRNCSFGTFSNGSVYRFNGAATARSRNYAALGAAINSHLRFNGAATARSRN